MENWGKRRLAYDIAQAARRHVRRVRGLRRARDHQEFERQLRLNENVLRFLSTRVPVRKKARPAKDPRGPLRRSVDGEPEQGPPDRQPDASPGAALHAERHRGGGPAAGRQPQLHDAVRARSARKRASSRWSCGASRRRACGEYLDKGSQVFVEGRLQTRDWEGKDGQKRPSTEVVAERVQFMSRTKGGAGGRRRRFRPRRPGVRRDEAQGGEDDVPFYERRPFSRGGVSHSHSSEADRSAAGSAGGRSASSARTRSTSSTTRTSAGCAASSPSAARSSRAASPAAAPATSASSRTPSSGRARWPCCPTWRRTRTPT